MADWAVEEPVSESAALARKLAVILHRMLITGEEFRWPQQDKDAAKS